ncbi:hypothetical protein M0R72_17965 [Candidatus Pacearchaeota archaeon]|jgi:hypothetical protein|nr:hypothetical protein [Candidatus Pacearchaeota archaeon]
MKFFLWKLIQPFFILWGDYGPFKDLHKRATLRVWKYLLPNAQVID